MPDVGTYIILISFCTFHKLPCLEIANVSKNSFRKQDLKTYSNFVKDSFDELCAVKIVKESKR